MSMNPLVAGSADEPVSAWSGVWIAEDIEQIGQGLRSGSWIDGTLSMVGAGLDGLALVSDPVGTLLQYGVAWLIEHVRPLSQALYWLAGDPGAIAAQAQTWRNVAASLQAESVTLAQAVYVDLTEWSGAASQTYREWADARVRSLQSLSSAADTTATIVEGAGALVGTVRMMVRDAVASVVSRLAVYAAELVGTVGLLTPLVVEQVSALCAAWGARIARWLRALISSLRSLLQRADRLAGFVRELETRLRNRGRNKDAATTDVPPQRSEEPLSPRAPEPPSFAHLELDSRKITDYAMNPEHPRGRNKYRVIHSATGLDRSDAALIDEQIRDGARQGTPVAGRIDQFGQRWTVDVPLSGPQGTITVRTAWIIDIDSSSPRLVSISFP